MSLGEMLAKWCGICGEKKQRVKYDWLICIRCDQGGQHNE